jgi:hypothetical protein
MKKLDNPAAGKGKQRQQSGGSDDKNDMHVDVSLKAFIAEQVDTLQSPLTVPTQKELECGDAEYRRVVKAIQHVQCALNYILLTRAPTSDCPQFDAVRPSMPRESEDSTKQQSKLSSNRLNT